MALLTALASAVTVASGSGPNSASYCVGTIETGQQSCFATEPDLIAYQEATGSVPLITFYRDIGAKQAGGYKNFASAYGTTKCVNVRREASDGDLRNDRFSNGASMDRSISSFKIRPGSGCTVVLFYESGFNGISTHASTGDCYDLRTCGSVDFNDGARSFILVGR